MPTIKTALELRNELTPGERNLLERSSDLPSYSEDVQYLVGKVKARLQAKGEDVEIDPGAIVNEYAQYLDKTHTNTQTPQEQASFSANMGHGLTEFGGALMLPILGRETKHDRVIREFHENQREEETEKFKTLLSEMPDDMSNLSATDIAKLQAKLSELEPDAILNKSVAGLQDRIDQVGRSSGIDTEATKAAMTKSHQSYLQKKQEEREREMQRLQKKGKTYKDPNKLDTEAIIKELQKAKTTKDRVAIFQRLYAHQQGLHAEALNKILSSDKRRFLFFGHKSLLSRNLAKGLFAKRKAEIKQKKDAIRAQRKAEVLRQKSVQKIERVVLPMGQTAEQTEPFERVVEFDNSDDSNGFSPIDAANKLYNTASDVRDKINLARKIFNFLKKLKSGSEVIESAEAAGSIFLNPYVLAVLAIFIVLVLLIILIVVLVQNGTITTSSGTAPGQSQCPGEMPAASGQMITILEQQFNITVHGSDTGVIADIYKTSCTLSKYTFLQLMHVPQRKIDVYIDSPGCTGHTEGEKGGYKVDVGACSSSAGNQFIVTHEFAHVIQFENPNLTHIFCSQVYHGSVRFGHCDASSPSVIPTYNCLLDYHTKYPGPYPEECFSDMAGAFLTYKDFHDTLILNRKVVPDNWQQMDNYPGNFPQYYNFAANYLFTPNASTADATARVSIAQQITQKLTKTFGRSIDLYDQIRPNPPGQFQIPSSPNPNYVVKMRTIKPPICARINGATECIGSRYFCTDLLIDTYNVALGKGVLTENLGDVESMINFWKSNTSQGFTFVHYRNASEHQNALTTLSQNYQGSALFFESSEGTHNGFEHVALIKTMILDTATGNGSITTYEANSGSTTGNYSIYHWQIKGVPYPVTGFGLYSLSNKSQGGI